MTESRIMERMDKTLETIEKLEALISKREGKIRDLHSAGHMADQFGDISAEESALAKNKQRLLAKQEQYLKLQNKLMKS